MAHPHLVETRAHFAARVQRSKNRLVAIPAAVQRKLGLERRPDNFIALVSLRPRGRGRWNHHYVKLTFDNEFGIPADVISIRAGDEVEVRIHRIIRDEAVQPKLPQQGAALLLALAETPRPGWRTDGSENVDQYLRDQERGS